MNLSNIYLTGFAGSGKTYCCNYLKEKYSYTQAKMANPVYMLAEKYFGMKNKDRKLLQTIGTDVGRDLIEHNLWVNRFQEDIDIVEETAKILNKEIRFVSDDVRFKNENDILKEMGWIGIFLKVPEEVRVKRLENRDGSAQVDTLNHKSETSIDEFKDDLIPLDASGTLEETYNNLEQILNQIGVVK